MANRFFHDGDPRDLTERDQQLADLPAGDEPKNFLRNPFRNLPEPAPKNIIYLESEGRVKLNDVDFDELPVRARGLRKKQLSFGVEEEKATAGISHAGGDAASGFDLSATQRDPDATQFDITDSPFL